MLHAVQETQAHNLMYLLSVHDRLGVESQKKGASWISDLTPCSFLLWSWDKGEANLNSTWATCQLSIFIAKSQFGFTFTRYCASLRPILLYRQVSFYARVTFLKNIVQIQQKFFFKQRISWGLENWHPHTI